MMLLVSTAACAPAPEPAVTPDPRDTARADPDRLTGDARTVADILQRGLAAEARDDGEELLVQARALSLIGARPQDGAPDLARQWANRAKALGAAPASTPPFRGRTLGPGYRSGRISAHGAFRTRQTYNAGQRAEIVVVPGDDMPLSLEVLDDEGTAVCSVAASTRNLGCRWVPSFTGANTIEVGNDNPHPVNFYIVLN